eukprot:TRINITY_DN3636_c0_g1_i1.p1 TRINITY_DN3636_c0_g1~~TRINITY_DN3636_c0_g1_i1.p1  ORF type:complete len:294 (+),score=48.78 TRINITY_DN3636_c0_g1_i1:85-966(+)
MINARLSILLILLCTIGFSEPRFPFYKNQFNPLNIDFNTLKTILFYAYSSYCPPNQLQNWDCYWCNTTTKVTQIFSDSTTNTYGWIGISGNTIVLSFRGTEGQSIQNWITDLESALHVPYPSISGATVAKGFYDAFSTISGAVISEAKKMISSYPGATILVTGHSLGAALSTLCAVTLVQNGFENVILRNFGAPRVGNTAFANWADQNVHGAYRVTNQHDIVPHLPTKFLGFYHIATELWFPTNDTTFIVCNGSGEDPSCADSMDALNIDDHLTYLGYDERSGHLHGCIGPSP